MTDRQHDNPGWVELDGQHLRLENAEPCVHCHCRECKHKRVCCWCDIEEREFDEGPDKDEAPEAALDEGMEPHNPDDEGNQ